MADRGGLTYWLVSSPIEGSPDSTRQRINAKTAGEMLSVNYKFSVPDLRVGTLDSLMQLSDELAKADQHAENIVHKSQRELENIQASPFSERKAGQERQALSEPLFIDDVAAPLLLQKFEWNIRKYPIKGALDELVQTVYATVGGIDDELKLKLADYGQTKTQYNVLARKETGSLLTCDISSLLPTLKPGSVVESEYLTTLFVVVSNYSLKDWETRYESLTEYVVPGSSLLVTQDSDYSLFRIVHLKKFAEEFKNVALPLKFTVRDVSLDTKTIEAKGDEAVVIKKRLEMQHSMLREWLRTAFGEVFVAWLHLKACRVFVESVLRYGLPVRFVATLVIPNRKSEQKLRQALIGLHEHLGGTRYVTDEKELEAGGASEFYNFVYLPVNLPPL